MVSVAIVFLVIGVFYFSVWLIKKRLPPPIANWTDEDIVSVLENSTVSKRKWRDYKIKFDSYVWEMVDI